MNSEGVFWALSRVLWGPQSELTTSWKSALPKSSSVGREQTPFPDSFRICSASPHSSLSVSRLQSLFYLFFFFWRYLKHFFSLIYTVSSTSLSFASFWLFLLHFCPLSLTSSHITSCLVGVFFWVSLCICILLPLSSLSAFLSYSFSFSPSSSSLLRSHTNSTRV